MIDDKAVKAIENLHRLKGEGIITEAEFDASKQKILFGPRPVSAKTGKAFPGLPAFTGDLPAANDHLSWITLPLRRYAEFEGRSSRKEFWMYQLLYLALILFTVIVYAADVTDYGEVGFIGKLTVGFCLLALLGLFVPLLAVEARRFHDQDRSGWLILLNLIPYVGAIIVLIMMILPGTAGENRFGPPAI